MAEPMIDLRDVAKRFTMHLMGGIELPVMSGVTFTVAAGACAVLTGPSGIGKSSILKMIYGNYRTDEGQVVLRTSTGLLDIATASPREIISVRRDTIAYVSQFLSAIPRVGARDLVAAAARDAGLNEADASERAAQLLSRLNLPERLWTLPPATFSGGERQRVNIACGFAGEHSVLLLDEPTASLDAANRDVVVELINERRRSGCAILGIFHDTDVRDRVASHHIDVTRFAPQTAAA
ncbi:MAG: phosphonate C-P lyase system protein PhnL [Pseudomonadota bacterium]